MSENNFAIRVRIFIPQFLALISIISLAIALRLIFVNGLVYLDDLANAQTAHDLTNGIIRLGDVPGSEISGIRFMLYIPVAALYTLFGVSEATTLAWPFLCSITTVILIYTITRLLADEKAALVAALLWALLPLDIRLANNLLPDGPLATFSAAAVLFFLLANRWEKPLSYLAYASTVLFIALAVFIKPTIFITVIFFIIYLLWKNRHNKRSWIVILIVSVVAAIIIFLGYYLIVGQAPFYAMNQEQPLLKRAASTATDWYKFLASRREFSFLIPLFIVAITSALIKPQQNLTFPLLWAASMFLYNELGSKGLLRYIPIQTYDDPRYILLVSIPFIVLSGIYLTQSSRIQHVRWLVSITALLTALIAGLGSIGAPDISWGAIGLETSELPFYVISSLCAAVAIFGSIISPLFIHKNLTTSQNTIALSILIPALALSTLNITYMTVTEARLPWKQIYPTIANALKNYPDQSIYVQNSVVGSRLAYESGYRLPFDYFQPDAPQSTGQAIKIAPADSSQIDNAIILIDEYAGQTYTDFYGEGLEYMQTPPDNWWQIAKFGEVDNHHVTLYWYSNQITQQDLEAARAAAQAQPQVGTLWNLMRIATNLSEYCEIVSAWQTLQQIDPNALPDFDPTTAIQHCYQNTPEIASQNLIRNPDFSQGFENWLQSSDWPAQRNLETDPQTQENILHITYTGGDWRAVAQEVQLLPATYYVYTLKVKSDAKITALYWEADQAHSLQSNTSYPEWNTLIYVFRTPDWNGQLKKATLYPILLESPGQVWLSQVNLAPIQLPAP